MKVLKEADKQISLIWGEGKIDPSISYRLFTYVIKAKVDDGEVLYNTVTGEMIHLDNKTGKLIESLPSIYMPIMNVLIKKHFLVKEELIDYKEVDSLRNIMKTLDKNRDITCYTILPTTCCNARCAYCYENGQKRTSMKEETVDDVIKFIISKSGNKKILIRWLGGEPLLKANYIDKISRNLKEHNISFSSELVTNGILINEAIIKKAIANWNLKFVHIPLDGTSEIYKKQKAYVFPYKDPYQKVLSNIESLINNKIDVQIRLNVSTDNITELKDVVNDLANHFSDKRYISIYSKALFDNCAGFHHNSTSKELLSNYQNELEELISQNGFAPSVELPKLRVYACEVDNPSCVCINPKGHLVLCENCTDVYVVGDVKEGIKNGNMFTDCLEHKNGEFCKKCSLYPFCSAVKMCISRSICEQSDYEIKQIYLKERLSAYYNLVVDKNSNYGKY